MKGKTDFDGKASQWDQNPVPVRIANGVSDAIIRTVQLTRDMDALDFGCGTGLVTMRLCHLVQSITGADGSQAMLDILGQKVKQSGASNVRAQLVDFENNGRVQGRYHLVVSSMTLHHVQDTAALFRHWHELLLPAGTLAFADLDAEDGTFHADNTGVRHFGFDREKLKTLLVSAGFRDIRDSTATAVVREVEGRKKEFPVFLMIAKKPG